MRFYLTLTVFLLAVFISAPAALFAHGHQRRINITATTSDLQLIAREIGGTRVDAAAMIHPTICPSQTDLSPRVLERVARSNIVLSRPRETWVSALRFKAVGTIATLYQVIRAEGNLMVPYLHIRAATEFLELISRLDPNSRSYYEANFSEYVYRIRFEADRLRRMLDGKRNVNIISEHNLKTFLEWLGFNVVATYRTQNELSARQLAELNRTIQQRNVVLVVDNLQAGTNIGFMLSEDNGLRHAVISNFPLGGSYLSTLQDNIQRISRALQAQPPAEEESA